MIIAPVGLGLRQAYGKMLVGVGGGHVYKKYKTAKAMKTTETFSLGLGLFQT